jgi:hypothetical protein
MITKTHWASARRIRFSSLWLTLLIWSSSLVIGVSDLLAGGGKPATQLVNVADTRSIEPGLTKWIADLYNTDLWLFSLFSVVVMALMGLILGSAFDRLMSLFGIHLGRIEHHE